jgi:hypothetical protein
MPPTGPQGVDETQPSTDSTLRGGDQPRRDQGDFPVGLIPILVPLLAVMIAIDAYFVLAMVL